MSYVLVLQPDIGERERISKALLSESLEPVCVDSASGALDEIRRGTPDAVVLEMFLEEQSGFALCRALRENESTADVAIVMVTASTADLDRILAFEAGADDVMLRPLSMRELALRVRAVIRRSQRDSQAAMQSLGSLRVGPLRLDTRTHTAELEGIDLNLTEREFAILGLLMQRPGRVFRREEILSAIWGEQRDPTSRAVDTHVKGIRRKLGRRAELIESLRGVGYRVTDRAAGDA